MNRPWKRYSVLQIFLIALLALGLSSCAKQALVKILENDLLLEGRNPIHQPPKQLPEFEGFTKMLENDSVINILMVPGVRRKEWSNYNTLISNIQHELKLKFLSMEHRKVAASNDPLIGSGEVTALRFIQKDLPRKRLNFYITNWTEVTSPAKNALYAFDRSPNGDDDLLSRTFLSDTAKQAYMVEIFSDMTLYRQPDYRKAIHQTVIEAMKMIADRQDEIHPTVCITGSMGSEIVVNVFNSFIKNEGGTQGNVELLEIIRNLKKLFMMNNQLVFSSILDYSLDDYYGEKQLEDKVLEQLAILLDFTKNKDAKVISFYDPNDILGFQIPDQAIKGNKLNTEQFINIPISHTTQWSVDAKRLRDNYLARFPLGKQKDKIMAMVGDTGRINVGFSLDGPSEFAKINGDVLNYLLMGYDSVAFELATANHIIRPERGPQNEHENGSKTKYGIQWRKGKKELKRKRASMQRVIRILYTISKMTRAVDLPYTRAPFTKIKGIAESIKNHDTTFVLTIHGMGNKTPNHFDQMADDIATRLGFIPDYSTNHLNTRQRVAQFHYGIRRLSYQNSENKHLIFVIVHWSPLVRPVKNQLVRLDSLALENARIPYRRRSFANMELKNKVIIDGFVDVNLALGSGGFMNLYGNAVAEGMRVIHHMDSSAKRNVFWISGSMGSRILYDHITLAGDPSPSERHITKAITTKTPCWYMLTNPIPMVSLKDLNETNRQLGFRNQIWHALGGNAPLTRGQTPALDMDVIAFHDPNDLLTFRLPESDFAQQDQFRVKNVPLRTGGGFEIDLLDMYKFINKVDKTLYKKLKEEDPRNTKDLRVRQIQALDKEKDLLNEMKGAVAAGTPEHQMVTERLDFIELEREKAQRYKKKKTLLLVPGLEGIYDMENTSKVYSQPFMVRFDKAHDKTRENGRILDVIAFGREENP